jgi:hypothetical protein
VITTGLVAGIDAGGVYKPPVEIVPTAADPPVVPFTCHVTAVFVSPVTVAVNCAVDPILTWLPLLTVTCGWGALGGPLWLEELHPASPSTPLSRPTPSNPQTKRKQSFEIRSPTRVAMPPSNRVPYDKERIPPETGSAEGSVWSNLAGCI